MKYFELTKEEELLLAEVEGGTWKSVKGKGEVARYQKYVSAALRKTKNINIRLSEEDLLRIRARALQEGIPYQTYIASLVHKHVVKS